MTGSIRGRFQRHPNSAMQPGMDQTPAIHSSLAPQLHSSTNDQLLCTTRWEKAAVDLVRCPPWSQGHLSSQEILLGVKLALQMLCVAAERQSSFNGLRVDLEDGEGVLRVACRKKGKEEKKVTA